MDNDLLQKLKSWRANAANLEGIELFRVFANKTLENIAELKPSNKEELMAIKGIKDRKFIKYGKEILAIINKYDQSGNGQEEIEAIFVSPNKILSVQELTSFINSRLSALGSLMVRGEITEVSPYQRFCFFTIKDAETSDHTISCFISQPGLARFSHLIETGMEVVITATPGLYKSGRFNLTVSNIEPYGEGALRKAFEALKKKLEAKGYFDLYRKRPVPEFVRKIGLITSESGAAIRDFRTNLGEYGFHVYLKDVRVEGDQAEASIISAIRWINKRMPDLDAIVLLRGGGSLENLKAFNSEGVADAIVTSRLPVVTGIGHERDYTIADFVADQRCSTPTAAAVFIRTRHESLINQLANYNQAVYSTIEHIIENGKIVLADQESDLFTAFTDLTNRYRIIIERMAGKLQTGLGKIFDNFHNLEQSFNNSFHKYESVIQDQAHVLDVAILRSLQLIERKFNIGVGRLNVAQTALVSLNPEAVLKRGYSIAFGSDNKVLKESRNITRGDIVNIKLYRGKVRSVVDKVER